MTFPAETFLARLHRTALVATSRVFYLSGYIQDVGMLAKMVAPRVPYFWSTIPGAPRYGGVKQLGLDFLVTRAPLSGLWVALGSPSCTSRDETLIPP